MQYLAAHRSRSTPAKAEGFSLVEVMATVVIVAVILGWAVPNLRTLILNLRITTQTNDFISDVHLTRSEAFTRGMRVTMCKSANGYTCSGSGDWGQGWIVFEDPDNTQKPVGPETIIRVHETLTGGNTLDGNRFVSDYLSYTGTGFSRLPSGAFQAGTLVLCDERGFGEHARAVIINSQGRPRAVPAPDSGKGSCFP